MRDEAVLEHKTAMVGVRDSARDGSTAKLRSTLHDLFLEVQEHEKASCVIAAGMITSALGLKDIPHITGPAGLTELAKATHCHQFPDVTDLPVWLVPGVRSGTPTCDHNTVSSLDMMRGEETLCAGLVELRIAPPPCTVLNLGSHWKAIQIDGEGRVGRSVTSLTGELIYATQTNTILASAVPHERPGKIHQEWAKAGMNEQRSSGLARALFCVRLLELRAECSAEERLSYLAGAYLASDFDGLRKSGLMSNAQPVLITGGGAVAELWRHTLAEESIPCKVLSTDQSEAAMLTGLSSILRLSAKAD